MSDQLVPACGTILGISTQPATMAGVESVEKLVGGRFDMVYRYHDVVQPIPDDEERQAVAQGRVLHIAIASRVYGDDAKQVTYQQIADGAYDSTLRAQGAGIASLKVPVFVTFEQEANQHRKLDVRGSSAQFIAAWRHVRQVYREAGATNAVWTWVMTGASENLARAATLWPGNDYVDWISWNVYNASGCNSGRIKPDKYKSFKDSLTPFYTWVHEQGPALGIDPSKPMMISEAGSVYYEDDPQKTADWYSQIPGVLAQYPQIKAFTFWASKTSQACDYRFQDRPAIAHAVAQTIAQPPLSQRLAIPTAGG